MAQHWDQVGPLFLSLRGSDNTRERGSSECARHVAHVFNGERVFTRRPLGADFSRANLEFIGAVFAESFGRDVRAARPNGEPFLARCLARRICVRVRISI